jgi:ribosome recycling factor
MQDEVIDLARAEMEKTEGLQVNYYGAKTPIRQVASLAAPEPRLIVITPYDKTALHEIEKAIQSSDLGLTPQNDGKIIRIPIPELTQDRRKELAKHVKKIAEEHRVGVRNHRRDANDMLKDLHKDKKITDDDLRGAEAKVQQFTTEFIEKLDKILAAKEAEIMEV